MKNTATLPAPEYPPDERARSALLTDSETTGPKTSEPRRPPAEEAQAENRRVTQVRFDDLARYLEANVSRDGSMVCASAGSCRASIRAGDVFAAAQMSYVGRHYDRTVDGSPFRVLVLGMDTGRPDEHVSLHERRAQLDRSASLPFAKRNPHMRGTTSALRVLGGGEPGEDPAGEMTELDDGTQAHLFDVFALVNIRLCSAVAPGSTESKGTSAMTANCLTHLAASLRILQPTVVVVQGVGVRRQIAPLIADSERISDHLEVGMLLGRPTLIASFTHPSAQNGSQHWGRLTSVPYLNDVVVPTLRLARRMALSRVLPGAQQDDAENDPVDAPSVVADGDQGSGHSDAESTDPAAAEVQTRGRLDASRVAEIVRRARRITGERWTGAREAMHGIVNRRRGSDVPPPLPPAPRVMTRLHVETCQACGAVVSDDGHCRCS